jgi:hypothetical protein
LAQSTKPRNKPYKLTDGEGMFLLVYPNGSKYWRMKFRFHGRERILAFGVYPDVGIVEARERRAQARKVLVAGKDNEHHQPALAQKKCAAEKPLPECPEKWRGSASHSNQGGVTPFEEADKRLVKCPAWFSKSNRKNMK